MVTTIHKAKQANGLNGQVGSRERSGHLHNGDPKWMDAEWRRSRALLREPDMPIPIPPNASHPIRRVPPKIGGEVSWAVQTNFARILPEVCWDPNKFGPCQCPCWLGCLNFSGPWAPPSPAPLTPESPVTGQINLVSEGINLIGRYGDISKPQHRK